MGTAHLFDLMNLSIVHPDVHEQAINGCYSYKKTNHQFSRITLDQMHEQNNAVIKGKGGVTDLLNRPSESGLIRWGTCGPNLQ